MDDEGDVLMDHPNVTHDFASAASRMRQERRWHAPQPVEDNATSQSRVESTGQNSRNSLVCSYTRSGESFVEQHWCACYPALIVPNA